MSVRPKTNMNYKVIISSSDGKKVEAWLPETFDLRLQSDWEPLLMNAMDALSIKGYNPGDILSGVFGSRIFLQAATGQVWRGTGPIEFNLQLQFDAETNAYYDVTSPIKQLIRWSTPYKTTSILGYKIETEGVLHAPGPIMTKTGTSGISYTLAIGNLLVIPNVIFPSLDVTWHTAPQSTGDFIAADVNLAIRTFYVPTQEDILRWFKTSGLADDGWIYE